MSRDKRNNDKSNSMSDEKTIPVRDRDNEAAVDEQDELQAAEIAEAEDATEPVVEASEIEQLKARVAELEDLRLRAVADFENYKKRAARQYDDMVLAANERLLIDLLDVVDNFDRALKHDDERPGERTEEGRAFREGTEMIYNQLLSLLEKYGVRPIDALGEPFDPQYHEALMQVASDDYDEGVVAMEMARGYCRGDRVLRHAKVGVSSGPANGSDDEQMTCRV